MSCRSLWPLVVTLFFFSSRRRHTRFDCDWSSDVCSSDLFATGPGQEEPAPARPGPGPTPQPPPRLRDPKSGVEGKRGDLGGRRIIKKKKKKSNGEPPCPCRSREPKRPRRRRRIHIVAAQP